MYYDELDIIISRPISAWHKTQRALAYTLMWVAGTLAVLLMIGAENATIDLPVGKDKKNKSKPNKKRWKANRFVVHEIVPLLAPGTTLEYTYNDNNAAEVAAKYFEFFKTYLEDVLKGERWVEGLPNVNVFGD